MALKDVMGKILYGALFVVLFPLLLIAWARATATVVTIPVLHSVPIGSALALFGGLLMASGWLSIAHYGGGLPMNAFPPERLVTRGAYRLVSHPIYVGFSALCFGVAIAAGSSSGFWLVSPTVALGCVALVLGYENPDLRARFGATVPRPWLSLPEDRPGKPTLVERLSLYPMVLIPWGAIYEAIVLAGVPPDAVSTRTPFDAHLAVLPWTEAIYVLTYPFVVLAPLMARSRADLRRFALHSLLAMALIFPLYLALPLVSPQPPVDSLGFWSDLMARERALDTPAASFPSFHVVWVLLAGSAWISRLPRARMAIVGFAGLVAASCVTTGMHSLADVLAGLGAYALVVHHARIWAAIRRVSERIANSWHEWRLGSLRVINHGAFAALSTFGGLTIVGALMGPGHSLSIFIAALSGLIGAALWAQWVEGSPSLLRPYGWYGGLLGILAGSLAAPLTGTEVFPLLAAYCVAGPWVQAMGRLRCLVQGCCHGHVAPEAIGIRYVHPRSRVTRLTNLGGRPVHPTQVYSILWNVVIAFAMGRLVSLHAPCHMLCGIYLILNGLGRFVEESYRGEPQTAIVRGLRLYQWAAIVTVVGGATMTAVLVSPPMRSPDLHPASVAVAALFAVITWFALGVDFPESNRRFARLV